MDKCDVLRAICELPGWQPPLDCSSVDRSLRELLSEGWIIPRLDGWEATPEALEGYPHFTLSAEGTVFVKRPPEEPDEEPSALVPLARVECMVRCMLDTMPLMNVIRVMTMTEAQLPNREGDLVWQVAQELVAQWQQS